MVKLSVVLIDNDPKMANYIRNELKRYYDEITVIQVFNLDMLLEILSSKAYDVIITEYELGWVDALTVLDYVKETNPYCPVIVFTTKLSFETFNEGIKRGLDDYVFKFPYASQRLLTSIRICLQNAHNLKKAKEAKQLYEVLFNSVPIALCMISETNDIIEVNNAFLSLFGFTSYEQVKRMDIRQFFVNGSTNLEELKSEVLEGQKSTKMRVQLKRRDGSQFWAEIHYRIIEQDEKEGLKLIFSIIDISETIKINDLKKRAFLKIEEVIEKNATIIDSLRNQLSVMAVLAELSENEHKKKLLKKIDEVDKLLSKMNEQMAISLKIKDFIKKYYE